MEDTLKNHLQELRDQTDLPLALGFGVANTEIAEQVAPFCDGVIVASALLRSLSKVARDKMRLEASQLAKRYKQALEE